MILLAENPKYGCKEFSLLALAFDPDTNTHMQINNSKTSSRKKGRICGEM